MIHIKLLTTSGCSRCDQARQVIVKVQPDFPDLTVETINLVDHPELAVQYGVMVSPALVVNEKVAFVGGVKEDQLRENLMQIREHS